MVIIGEFDIHRSSITKVRGGVELRWAVSIVVWLVDVDWCRYCFGLVWVVIKVVVVMRK